MKNLFNPFLWISCSIDSPTEQALCFFMAQQSSITHVFAFPRSGTTSLSEWLTENSAVHEFEMANISRVLSQGIKNNTSRLNRFLKARSSVVGRRVDITTNLFVFASEIVMTGQSRPCILLRNPIEWCASFLDMFFSVWHDMHELYPTASTLSACEAWRLPPWGGSNFLEVLQTPFPKSISVRLIQSISHLMLTEWCEHALFLLDLSLKYRMKYITTSMLADKVKMTSLFFENETPAMNSIGIANSGVNSSNYQPHVRELSRFDCKLTGAVHYDQRMIEKLFCELNKSIHHDLLM
ncbi:MAG: hypothetical protein AB8E87_01245 [Prochlorococcus sp.]